MLTRGPLGPAMLFPGCVVFFAVVGGCAFALVSTDPVDGATGVPFDKTVSGTFTRVMNPLTINTATFTLDQGTTPVSGTAHTATVWMEAADTAGLLPARDYAWTLTTGITTVQKAVALGTNSVFAGNILAGKAITLTTGATLESRALTQAAAVTLDAAVITVPSPDE